MRSRNTYVFLPMAGRDLVKRRRETARTLACLIPALTAATPETGKITLHIHVNGPYDSSMLAQLSRVLRAQRFPSRLTTQTVQDKISAVNFGLVASRQAQADTFLTVDNDLYFPVNVIRRMLEIYHAGAGRCPVGCEKIPFVPSRATAFQRAFSIFGEFVVRSRILDNRRISGSLYVVNPYSIDVFPSGCNEGDYLTQIGALHSNEYIYSPYPSSFREEVLRRRRLAIGAAATGYRREFQNAAVVGGWLDAERVVEAVTRYQLWPPFLTFARVMLHDVNDGQLIINNLRIPDQAIPDDGRTTINLVDFVSPVEPKATYPRWWLRKRCTICRPGPRII